MLIKIKKGRDGPNVLVCTRADGSVAMQHQRQPGFYTLLAQDWSFDDFNPAYPRGRISLDAELSERIVGLLDVERGSGVIMSADDANASIREHYVRQSVTREFPVLTQEQIAAIRRLRSELLAQWSTLAPGESIELDFPR